MNRMADRIPVRYVMLLSLFVMVMGLIWHAPAPAAAATTDSTTVGSPTPSPTTSAPTTSAPTTSTPAPSPSNGIAAQGEAATAPPDQSVDNSLEELQDSELKNAEQTPTTAPPGNAPADTTEPPASTTNPSDGSGTDEGSTGGPGGSGNDGTNDGAPVTDPAGDGGGTTNDGGTTSGGGTLPDGADTGGTDTGGTPPSTVPQPAPSHSTDPTSPTVEMPPGSTGLPSPTPSPVQDPKKDPAATTPAAPAAPGKDGAGTPEPKVEKIVLIPGDSETPSVVAGSEVSAELDGVDGDGKYRLVSGELPPGLMLGAKTGKITGTAQQVGTYSFTIEYASEHQNAIQSYTLKVAEQRTHIEAPPLEPARAGEPYEAVVLRTEGGVGPFTYKLKGSELGGTSEAPTTLRTAPWVSEAAKSVADVLNGSSQLQDDGPLTQPVADSEGAAGVKPGGSHVGNLPAGMRLEGGVLAGEPKPEAAGNYSFTIVSTDRYGSTAEQEMTITVLSEGEAVPIAAGEDTDLTSSPAQLSEELPGQAAAAEPEGRSALLPMILGLLLLGAGTAAITLRHRRTVGTHR
ncbi:MAG TPA: Ig domain-containing protein [Arthrobacter sp.]|nr:Ig domain-containing protein [Arthrobacter sp.]